MVSWDFSTDMAWTSLTVLGRLTHCVYICFGLFTNILVTAMLLTGGSAVVTSLTGMHTAAACFLLPLGVVVYTMFGGYVIQLLLCHEMS